MNKDILKQYAWLFRVNLIVSAFTFGGGYVVVPMLKKHFVTNRHVLSEEELFDIAAIALLREPLQLIFRLSQDTG